MEMITIVNGDTVKKYTPLEWELIQDAFESRPASKAHLAFIEEAKNER